MSLLCLSQVSWLKQDTGKVVKHHTPAKVKVTNKYGVGRGLSYGICIQTLHLVQVKCSRTRASLRTDKSRDKQKKRQVE